MELTAANRSLEEKIKKQGEEIEKLVREIT